MNTIFFTNSIPSSCTIDTISPIHFLFCSHTCLIIHFFLLFIIFCKIITIIAIQIRNCTIITIVYNQQNLHNTFACFPLNLLHQNLLHQKKKQHSALKVYFLLLGKAHFHISHAWATTQFKSKKHTMMQDKNNLKNHANCW